MTKWSFISSIPHNGNANQVENNSIAMYKVLKTLHPGGVRTHDEMTYCFFRPMLTWQTFGIWKMWPPTNWQKTSLNRLCTYMNSILKNHSIFTRKSLFVMWETIFLNSVFIYIGRFLVTGYRMTRYLHMYKIIIFLESQCNAKFWAV
jgi:hypothetical protein